MVPFSDASQPGYSRPILAAVAARTRTKAVAVAVAGSFALWASAKVSVPFWPVPMTMQTFVILVIGGLCGARLAGATVLVYLAEGLAGLPVFAGPIGGAAVLFGPTGGYLAGFFVAAVLIGHAADRGWGRSLAHLALAMTVGHLIILAMGVSWLAQSLGWERAVAAGLTPFWAATVLKTALAITAVAAAGRLEIIARR